MAVEPVPLRRFSARSAAVVLSVTSFSAVVTFCSCKGGGGGGRGGGLVGQGLLISEDVGRDILRAAGGTEEDCVVGEPAAAFGDVGLAAAA